MLAACSLNRRLEARPGVESSPGYAPSSVSLSQSTWAKPPPLLVRPITNLFKAIHIYLHLPLCSPYPLSRRYAPMIDILVHTSSAFSLY
jgi:hypothetical protein